MNVQPLKLPGLGAFGPHRVATPLSPQFVASVHAFPVSGTIGLIIVKRMKPTFAVEPAASVTVFRWPRFDA